jgi:ankyrin repeat protein
MQHGLTALHLAAESGHEALVRMLLNSTSISTRAVTALHVSYRFLDGNWPKRSVNHWIAF